MGCCRATCASMVRSLLIQLLTFLFSESRSSVNFVGRGSMDIFEFTAFVQLIDICVQHSCSRFSNARTFQSVQHSSSCSLKPRPIVCSRGTPDCTDLHLAPDARCSSQCCCLCFAMRVGTGAGFLDGWQPRYFDLHPGRLSYFKVATCLLHIEKPRHTRLGL